MMTRLLIAGDTCPIGRNQPLFQRGDAEGLLGDLLPEFEDADLVIANLECPLIEREEPIAKVGPNLGAPAECINGLKAIEIDVAGLANNHIMDHGAKGLQSTIEALKGAGVDYVGAGEDLDAAGRVLVREIGGIRIGIIAMAENEFGMAGARQPGANPLNPISAVRSLAHHKETLDIPLVLLHAGNEHYPYPRPGLLDLSRFLVEQGAGAVICQHSHCVGCMEVYRDRPIVYGQGNFLFDVPSASKEWKNGALVALDVKKDMTVSARLIPFRQPTEQPGLAKVTSEEEERFWSDVLERSTVLLDESRLLERWDDFCRRKERYYLNSLHGRPGPVRRLAGRLGLLKYLVSRESQRIRLNTIRCESHREALIRILSVASMERDRKRE